MAFGNLKDEINQGLVNQSNSISNALTRGTQEAIASMAARDGMFRPINPTVAVAEAGFADKYCKQLQEMIKNFESTLDNLSEVGVQLVSFGQAIRFHLKFVGYSNPYLIVFKGVSEKGDPVELIQHVSQISILFLKLKREKPTEPKQPIGFGPATMQE